MIPETARQPQAPAKKQTHDDFTKSHLDVLVGPVNPMLILLHDRRALVLRFPCDISHTSGSRTNLNEIRLGGVSAAQLPPTPSHEISCIMSIYCIQLNADVMFVIAEKGGRTFAFHLDLFILICNGDDQRTTIVRCFYDSLVKSHASSDSHKASMRFLTDVSWLTCNF